ncbi:MAG TPA: hypothetical protein VND95_11790 [Stellaceae bacterium]|nr:hypothetical protein [Stellaceae bacterium]
MTVSLRYPRTGEIKVFAEGWSWRCCIGCGILGLPLFRLGLQVWGAAMVAFNIVALIVAFLPSARASMLNGWLTVIWLGLCVFFGLKANELAVNRYLGLGWEYVDRPHNRF